MWSDSTTVIQWIRSSNEKQPIFVAKRVAKIFDTSTVDDWHHIPGNKNPNDLGTQGVRFDEIAQSDWIKGPDWLREPIALDEDNLRPAVQEVDQQIFVVKAHNSVSSFNWTRFSQFRRLRRTVA